MQPLELERMADRHVPGAGKLEIRLLSRGLVNDTYRVGRGGSAYAMRVDAANPDDRGPDRAWEATVLARAAAADLAPAIEYCDLERGILISRWVEGRSWNAADVRRPSGILRMAELMRRVHTLPMPAPARLMNAKMWIERYFDPAGAAALRIAAGVRLAELAAHPGADPVICHSDLHTLNLIDRGESLLLLDWEYAHAAEPMWDLAGWSANNDFGEELRRDLLTAYNGRPPAPGEMSRLNSFVWLYDYVCLLWCELHLKKFMGGSGDPAREGIAARARQLAMRLDAAASGRVDQVPAH